MTYATVNGLTLYYETHGRGRPLVLLRGAASQALPLSTASPANFTGAEGFVEIVGIAGQPNDL